MTRLTCKLHHRRVQLIDATAAIVHRQDGYRCESSEVVIGGRTWTPVAILAREHIGYSESYYLDGQRYKTPAVVPVMEVPEQVPEAAREPEVALVVEPEVSRKRRRRRAPEAGVVSG